MKGDEEDDPFSCSLLLVQLREKLNALHSEAPGYVQEVRGIEERLRALHSAFVRFGEEDEAQQCTELIRAAELARQLASRTSSSSAETTSEEDEEQHTMKTALSQMLVQDYAPAPATQQPKPAQEEVADVKECEAMLDELLRTAENCASSRLSQGTRELAQGPPDIPSSEIELGAKIGAGSYGTVYRGRVRGKLVAVKVPRRQDLNAKQRQAFLHEVAMLKKIFHQNVVLFLGACTEPAGRLMIVTALMSCDLNSLIHDKKQFPRLPLAKKLQIAQGAAYGINWLHGICHIVHRDLKPANILLDDQLNAKVTDFGFSEVLHEGDLTRDRVGANGTTLYMAPEVLLMRPFGTPADMYSFGLILYELVTENELFPEHSELAPFVRAVAVQGERPPLEPLAGLPQSLRELITDCWDSAPEKRPRCAQVIDRLDYAAVDVATHDSDPQPLKQQPEQKVEAPKNKAAEFWKSVFTRPLQTEVTWNVFSAVLSRSMQLSPVLFERLRQHLARPSQSPLCKNRDVVSLARFSLYYAWFGNFFAPPHGALGLRSVCFLSQSSCHITSFLMVLCVLLCVLQMDAMLAAPWCHGEATMQEAQRRLAMQANKTFLVRFSLRSPVTHPFTISRVANGVVLHQRVARVAPPAAPHSAVLADGADGPAGADGPWFATHTADDAEVVAPTMCELVRLLMQTGFLGQPCPMEACKLAYGGYSC